MNLHDFAKTLSRRNARRNGHGGPGAWDKCLIAYAGDFHCNHKTALCPPTIYLDEGATFTSSPVQDWIRERFYEFSAAVADEKSRLGWPVLAICNGELVDMNEHNQVELASSNDADALAAMQNVLAPYLESADKVVVTRGTEAHTKPMSSLDELAARFLAQKYPVVPSSNRETVSWYNWRRTIGGIFLDVAHHPGTASRVGWTAGNDANRLAAGLIIRYAEKGLRPPDLAIRGHNHRKADSYDNHSTRAIIAPSWQLTGSYGYRLGGDWLPIGGLLVYVDRGDYEVRKFYTDWPVEQEWEEHGAPVLRTWPWDAWS